LLLFSSLVIDGFPAGAAVLREFGARPTNFLLLVAWMFLASKAVLSGHALGLRRSEVLLALVVILGIPALNLPVTLLQAEVPPEGPLVDWLKQYAMLIWGMGSYWIWVRLLKGIDSERVALLLCWGSVIPLISFFADLSGSAALQDLLAIFRIKRDDRISGLATEPSLYAAWLAFVWPILLYYGLKARKRIGRAFGWILLVGLFATAYLSHARTIAVIAVLQIAYAGYWLSRRTRGLQRLRVIVAIAFLGSIFTLVFFESITSLTDTDMGSNVARVGSTITALRVALAHPVVGVGIGQLKYFFGQYAPNFALASEEILGYAVGVTEYRASSFNLIARFFCEFGFAIGLMFTVIVLHPLVSGVKRSSEAEFLPYAILAAIGGTGFWLSQDQYGYQPAILSLAIVSTALANSSRMRGA
jgi:hypothetical protein